MNETISIAYQRTDRFDLWLNEVNEESMHNQSDVKFVSESVGSNVSTG